MNFLSNEASAFVLPLQLADGLVLSGIELECQGCARSYRLTHGLGRASGKGRRIALAAQACCPDCAEPARFLVVVDLRRATARVQRVSKFGLWLAQTLIGLRTGARSRTAAAATTAAFTQADHDAWSALPAGLPFEGDHHAAAPAAAPVLAVRQPLLREDMRVHCSADVLGFYQGMAIPASIHVDGLHCHYAGIAPQPVASAVPLAPGEHVLVPGLLYREDVDLMA